MLFSISRLEPKITEKNISRPTARVDVILYLETWTKNYREEYCAVDDARVNVILYLETWTKNYREEYLAADGAR